MQLIRSSPWVVLVDLLLPAAVLIFLLPINPSISTATMTDRLMRSPLDPRWGPGRPRKISQSRQAFQRRASRTRGRINRPAG